MDNQQSDSFFITQEKVDPAKRREQNKKLKTLIWVLVGIIYAILAATIAFALNVSGKNVITILVIYCYGLIGGVGILITKGVFARSEKNRQILVEVLENSRAARLITDKDDNVVYSNIRFEKLLPEHTDITLDAFSEIFTNARKARHAIHHLKEEAFKGHEHSVDETAYIENRKRWFHITTKPIKGWKDYIHWRIDDLTEQYEVEDTLRHEREKLSDFMNNAPVGFFSVNETGNFTFMNSKMAKLLALEEDTALNQGRLHDFLLDKPENVEPFEVFEDDDDHQVGEISMVDKDGRVFKAAITHSIVREKKSGKIRSRSVVYDLTAEHEIEAALQETQDSFERLFEEAPVGICLLARDGAIDAANHSFAKIIGHKSQDVTHKLFTDFIHEDDYKTMSEWIETLFQSHQKSATIEIHLKAPQNPVVQIFARKFRGGDSMVLHFIDLTEQKSLEQQFTQSQKMQAIGQLAGGIAHDFNNLLTAIIGFCDLLLLRHKPGDPSFSDIMQIKQNSNRAANLVRQLLAFSRQQTLQPKVMDIADVLSELSHLIRRLIGATITLNIEHNNSEPGHIKVDQGQLEQVLINLAVNARDAMPEGGALNITTSFYTNTEEERLETNDLLPAGTWVKIDIQDTGTGIPAEIIDRIFEPFFTTKELGAGTGLGLSTVHGIIHQTGGFLSLDTHIGQGTTFSIFLPIYHPTEEDNALEKQEKDAGEADLTGTAKILLVEDEDAVRGFSARALSNKGYNVLEAMNGQDAMNIIEQEKPELELIITDVVMPEMDGPTMIETLRPQYPDVKIIFMSGYTEDRLKQQFGDDIHFLPKPFTLKQLATKVKEVLQ